MKMPRIVIVGAGFGGLKCAEALGNTPARVTVLDRTNYSLFQPLLYQAATSILSTEDISIPIRSALRRFSNVEVLMSEVHGIDIQGRRILDSTGSIPYDALVLAAGARYNYFGHDEWSEFAPSLKTASDAEQIRHRILEAFELAEREKDPERIKELMTIVMVGAGPTGVELAGTLASLTRMSLQKEFRHIRPENARIIMIEALPRILSTFDPKLSEAAHRRLEKLGVEIRVNSPVKAIERNLVKIGDEQIRAHTILWTAGIYANPVGKWLNLPVDKNGRVTVGPDCSIPGHHEIFVIGDAAHFEQDGKPLPGVAQVAIQQGKYVGRRLRGWAEGKEPTQPFRYRDKGYLAVVGRNYAVAQLPRAQLKGFFAWSMWLFIHLIYNLNLKNKILVLIHWAWNYVTHQRTVRSIDPDREITQRQAKELPTKRVA
jgi:NADH dehydrogenase